MSDEATTPAPAAPAPAPGADPAPAAPEAPAAPSEPATTPPSEAPAETAPPAEAAAESDEVVRARKILAAANKRSERAMQREQAARAIEERAKAYEAFQANVRRDPRLLVRYGGFPDLQSYLKAVTEAPPEEAGPTIAEQRIQAIEQRIKAEDAAAAKERADEQIEAARVNVMKAMDANPRYDRVTGEIGHGLVWQEINAYFELHGQVPDAAIWMIADRVEKSLVDEGLPSKRKPKAPAATAPTALTNALTKTSPPAANGEDDLPMDGKARMAAILARWGKPSTPVS